MLGQEPNQVVEQIQADMARGGDAAGGGGRGGMMSGRGARGMMGGAAFGRGRGAAAAAQLYQSFEDDDEVGSGDVNETLGQLQAKMNILSSSLDATKRGGGRGASSFSSRFAERGGGGGMPMRARGRGGFMARGGMMRGGRARGGMGRGGMARGMMRGNPRARGRGGVSHCRVRRARGGRAPRLRHAQLLLPLPYRADARSGNRPGSTSRPRRCHQYAR